MKALNVWPVLVVTVLAGCINLEPRYGRPAAPIPQTFPTGPAYPAATGSAVPPAWRVFFPDARLRAVIGDALANNRDLRAAVANVAIARDAWRAQRAQLYPTLNAQGGAVLGRFPTGVSPPTPGALTAQNSVTTAPASGHFNEQEFTAELAVTDYELDLFGRVRSLTKAAFEAYLANADARRAAQITLVAQVATAWLTLGSDRSLLAIAQSTLVSAGQSLDVTRARLDHGVASGVDVDQARTIVEQARFDVARLTTQCAQDQNALDLLVGAPVAENLAPTAADNEAVVLPDLPAGVRSSVLLDRPDVSEAEHQLKSANADIGAARAAFFPTVSLTGDAGLASAALANLFTGPSATWSFAPLITAPIFDAGKNRAALAQAKATRALNQAQYEKAIQSAFRDVANALAQRGTIERELAAQRALADAAADNLRLANARYVAGADTYLNVLIAQRTLYSAQQTLAATLLTRQANLVALYQALGGGLD